MLDCYRAGVARCTNMVVWAQNGRETPAERGIILVQQERPVPAGYIAEHSGHSRGAAVDLTLVDLKADNHPGSIRQGLCRLHGGRVPRAPEGSVDMGTGYDCSDGWPYRGEIHHISPAPMAEHAGAAMASKASSTIRRMVAFLAAGAAGPAYDFSQITARHS